MLKNPDNSYSLSRSVFAMAWLVSITLLIRYLFTDLSNGAAVAAAVGAVLTPAGAVYAMRAHSQGMPNQKDPKCLNQ